MDYEQIVFQMSEWAKHKYSTGLEAIPNPDPAIKQKKKKCCLVLEGIILI